MAFNDLEPATTVWELWSAPWTGPGMNSRNHHMFSSISEWLLTTVGGLSNAVCLAQGGPAVMRPAVVRDISAYVVGCELCFTAGRGCNLEEKEAHVLTTHLRSRSPDLQC